jgi:hypothetical protein
MKPKSIEVGKCYRMRRHPSFINYEPSDSIAYVYAIDGAKQRWVRVEWVSEHGPGWNAESYSGFLRLVHSEAPTAKN